MAGSHVVFDATKTAPLMDAVVLIGLLVMLLVGVGSLLGPRSRVGWLGRLTGRRSVAFNILWTGAVVTLALIGSAVFGSRWVKLNSEAHSPAASTVEGCITRFHPSSGQRGDDTEMIEIGNQRFTYSDDDQTPAFHRTAFQGGPMHPDTWAKLTHLGSQITKVEVVEHACPPAPVDGDWRVR